MTPRSFPARALRTWAVIGLMGPFVVMLTLAGSGCGLFGDEQSVESRLATHDLLSIRTADAEEVDALQCEAGTALRSDSCDLSYATKEPLETVVALYRHYFTSNSWEGLVDGSSALSDLWVLQFRNEDYGGTVVFKKPSAFGDTAPEGASVIVVVGVFQ